MIYEAELIDGVVVRVIASPEPGWAASNCGGTWRVCGDPTESGVLQFAGLGFHHDPGIPEQFVGDEWDSEKATVQGVDGLWAYNTTGQLVWHDGRAWRNLMPTGNPNVWEPPTNWREYPMGDEYPLWIQPSGSVDAYTMGFIVEHNSLVWQSELDANVWEPGVSGWKDMSPPGEIAVWVQPTGAHDDYDLGAVVTHNGQTWTSTVNGNVWEPGVFGWDVVP